MKKIIIASITAVVVLTVLAGVLVPVLDDATTTEKTFTNNSYLWRMSEIENGDIYIYDGTGWTLNGENIDISLSGSNAIVGGNWCIRSNGQLRGSTISGNATSLTATAGELTVALSGTAIATYTVDLPAYGADKSGDYIMTDGAGYNYVLGESVIYGTGQSAVDGVNIVVHVEGNVKDGVTFTASAIHNGTAISDVVITDETVNATAVDGYNDLYNFESCTATISFNTISGDITTAHTGTVTYNRVVVPYEVTAERTVHFTDGQNALFNTIPVFIILGLLLAIIALAIKNKGM